MRHPLAAALAKLENHRVPTADADHQFNLAAACIRAELVELECFMNQDSVQRMLKRGREIFADGARPTTNIPPMHIIIGHLYDMAEHRSRGEALAEFDVIISEYDEFLAAQRLEGQSGGTVGARVGPASDPA